jgi:hypothetical protein
MPRQEGYHFNSGPEGMLAIEADQPYPGAVTVSWRPIDGQGRTTTVMPMSIFAPTALAYVKRIATIQANKEAKEAKKAS